MFASRAIRSTQSSHRYASSAKFTNTRHIVNENEREADIEDETHPKRSLMCALLSSIFCPIFGFIAFYYGFRAVRAQNQGYFAEAALFNKKAIRWSLITFICGLIIGSLVAFIYFVKTVVVF